MNYVLLCPKKSFKNRSEEIKALGGFWNGIGYAFPPGTKSLINEWAKPHEVRYLIEVPLLEGWEEYKTLCREDWEYLSSLEEKLEIYCLEQMEPHD